MNKQELRISPLGAAIVEAMPDRKRIAAIKRGLKRGVCPVSAIYDASRVEQHYKERGRIVKAIEG